MKFVFFGYDYSIDVLHRLRREGHDLGGLYTFPCDNIFNFNRETIALAAALDVPLSETAPTAMDIQRFLDQGVDLFISCGYPYKIPPIDEHKAYGINAHPSLLPKARGLMPTPHIIIHQPDAAGFTLHKISDGFDAGDILYQHAIPLSKSDTTDIYAQKIMDILPDKISEIVENIERFWADAAPQDESKANRVPVPNEAMRTLNWSHDIEEIDRTARAFGSFGSIAIVNGKAYAVFEWDWEKAAHDFPHGTLTNVTDAGMTIAAADGFFTMKRYQAL